MTPQVIIGTEDSPPTTATAEVTTVYHYPSAAGARCQGADSVFWVLSATDADVLTAAVCEFSNDPAAGWLASAAAGMTVVASNATAALNAGGAVVSTFLGHATKSSLVIPWKHVRLALTVGAAEITDLKVETNVVAPAHAAAGG